MDNKITEFDAADALPKMKRELTGAAALALVLSEVFTKEDDPMLNDFFMLTSYGLSAFTNDERSALANLDEILRVAALLRKFYEVNFDGFQHKERGTA